MYRLDLLGFRVVRIPCNPAQLLARTSRGIDKRLSFADAKENSDATLILSVRSGDQRAMGELYDRYSSLVYSVALRVLGDTGAAEDILQEVFMQLWRKPTVFDSARGSLAAWLAVIARNRAIDAIRKRKPETDIGDVIVSVEQDFVGEAERNRAAEHIRRKLSEMPEPQRSALEMAFFEGLTHSEIATKTGTPLGTIKTRIRTALISLRTAVVK
jgi:RNA polymerase sigma-70 factor (ECF subfamily)